MGEIGQQIIVDRATPVPTAVVVVPHAQGIAGCQLTCRPHQRQTEHWECVMG